MSNISFNYAKTGVSKDEMDNILPFVNVAHKLLNEKKQHSVKFKND